MSTLNYNIIGEILFSEPLHEIRKQLEFLRKDSFDHLDRIVIKQDSLDEYPYVDGVGTKLIEIQKIINQVDISNCFILLITSNSDVLREIQFITKFYAVDPNPIDFQLIDGVYEKVIKKYPNTSCKKLWNHLYVGTDGNTNPCCVADHKFPMVNVDDIDTPIEIIQHSASVRSDMVQGYRHRACSVCYEKEDVGIISDRQICDPKEQTLNIQSLDIRLNNICNFKCRSCSEYFSSAIKQETIEIYGKDAILGYEKVSLEQDKKQVRNQRLEKVLPFVTPDIQSIYFAGGEPLITAEHYEILDQLISLGNTDLAISYNTNLSMLSYKKTNVIDKWNQFSNVTVGASIDGSGPVAEYLRHGTIWNDILDNIYDIKKHAPHVKLLITSTIAFLNIENVIDLQNTWIEQNLFSVDDFKCSVIIHPTFLSPAVLPQHHKHRLENIIMKHIQKFPGTSLERQWHDVLKWMNGNDYTYALKEFAQRTRILDEHRNESFVHIFPEFKELYTAV